MIANSPVAKHRISHSAPIPKLGSALVWTCTAFMDASTALCIPCTWVIDHGEIKPVWTWKSHPYWLTFTVSGDVLCTLEDESSSYWAVSALSYNNGCPGKACLWNNTGRYSRGVSNHFSIECKSSSTRWNTYMALLLGQKPMTRQGIGPKVVLSTVILLS